MILPGSFLFSLILLILSLLCWGSWANTLKLAGPKWRFELYCYDFALGAFLAALIIGFTFGSLGFDGFTVMDDLRLAGRRQDVFAFAGGVLFCLGNFLILAAMSVAGMAVAFPVGLGTALIAGTLTSWLMNPAGSSILLVAGCAAILAGIAFCGLAAAAQMKLKAAAAQAAAVLAAEEALAQNKPGAPGKTKKLVKKKAQSGKALLLAAIGGLFIGAFLPLLASAQQGENGNGPYTTSLIATLGILASTFVYNLFFMNLPIQGAALDLGRYFKGQVADHAYGLAGGMIWLSGTVLSLVAARAEGAAHPAPALTYGLGQSAIVVPALWGLIAWKEFSGAESNTRLYLGVSLLLLTLGIVVTSIAAVYGGR